MIIKYIKKIILLVTFLFITTNLLVAQKNIRKPFSIKAGYQQSDLRGAALEGLSQNGETSVLNSFMIGAEYNSQLSRFFSLKHELNFNINGANVMLKDEVTQTNYESKLEMHSIELQPLNFTFRLVGFQLYAGPYVSSLVNASIARLDNEGNKYKDRSIFGKPDEETEDKRYLQKIDFGVTTGILYEFNNIASIGVRWNRGVVPIFDNAAYQETIKIYKNSFGVVLGVNL